MLDVHAPDQPIRGWKSFVLHVATIVLGLLLAVAVEQTVEFFHHRQLAQQARLKLLEEVRATGESAKDNDCALRMHQKHLEAALQVLDRARKHALLPTYRIITGRGWQVVQVAAWKTVRQNGAAAYLSNAEQDIFELANWDAGFLNSNNLESTAVPGRAAMVVNLSLRARNEALPALRPGLTFQTASDAELEEWLMQRAPDPEEITKLSPAAIDRLEQAILSALYDEQRLLLDCSHLISQAEDIPKQVLADSKPGSESTYAFGAMAPNA